MHEFFLDCCVVARSIKLEDKIIGVTACKQLCCSQITESCVYKNVAGKNYLVFIYQPSFGWINSCVSCIILMVFIVASKRIIYRTHDYKLCANYEIPYSLHLGCCCSCAVLF